jgi:hypothetical protein
MIPAPVIPRAATPIVAVSLLIISGLGGYLGYSHAPPPPGGGGESATTVAPAAVAAKAAAPIPAVGADVAPDEAFIRRIAREEAEAALHPKHAVPAPDADGDAPDAPYQPAPVASQPSTAPSAAVTQPSAPQNATQPPNP